MKKITLFAALAFVTLIANAQDEKSTTFKPFKFDISLGYAIPGSSGGSGTKAGALFALEPKYAIMQNLSLGLRLETALMARAKNDGSGDTEVKGSGSYVLTGDYYFTDNYSFRPFGGIGAGLFTSASASTGGSGSVTTDKSKFGGLVRAGFEARHFRLGAEYNLIPSTVYVIGNGFPDVKVSHSYIGLKLGIVIGGGPR